MTFRILFLLSLILSLGCSGQSEERHLFFLHNRFLEEHELNDAHPDFGRTEYKEIINQFESHGLKVISEIRDGNVNALDYARGLVRQIDSLVKIGIEPTHITLVGTSKGGYIAQYVSTLANNPNLNFVFIGSFRISDMEEIPEINYCGNILTIYEKSDPFGVSALKRKEASTCKLNNFKEVELNTGLGHGFLFRSLDEWICPSVKWAFGNYGLD